MEETSYGGCLKIKQSSFILILLGMILLSAVIIVSILRDRIVNVSQNQVTVFGQGKVSYQPNEAQITLGVQVDKVPKAEDALNQINEKANQIISAVKELGIKEEDIKTQNYSLYPQYDYKSGVTVPSGYNANEQLVIKVKNVDQDKELVGRVVSTVSGAGANQVTGINYSVSNLNDLKQEARIKAIFDAKGKSEALFSAAEIKGKPDVVSWYENNVMSPDMPRDSYGLGGSEALSAKALPMPQIPSGTQEIVIDIGVNYEVK